MENLPEVQFINPRTGKYSKQWNADSDAPQIRPNKKQEQAIVLWTLGELRNMEEAAGIAGVGRVRFSIILNSPAGQAIVDRVKGELDSKYQSLYKKFIRVIEDGLDSANSQVALAAAALFAKTQIGTKHVYEISAEDVVQQIMQGTYKGIEDAKK